MTLANPGVLWLLPLAALPWLALLVRRRPGRVLAWGAGRFLPETGVRSARWLRLRRAGRALLGSAALACLVGGTARPVLFRGDGWHLQTAPELVVIGLDRSPAMEAATAGGRTRRDALIGAMQARAGHLAGHTRFAMVDTQRRAGALPVDPARLAAHPAASALDVPTDLPLALTAALDRIDADAPGTAEVWLGAGLHGAAWQPDQPAWQELRDRLGRTSGRVRVRWIAAPAGRPANLSLRLLEVGRDDLSAAPHARVAIRGQSRGALTLMVHGRDGPRPFVIPAWSGDGVIQDLPLGQADDAWVGEIRLADDANPTDNTAYIAIPARSTRLSLIACADALNARLAAAAAAPDPAGGLLTARATPFAELTPTALEPAALVVLDRLPEGPAREALLAFIEAGGTVLVLPEPAADGDAWLGVRRGEAVGLAPSPCRAATTPGATLLDDLPLAHLEVRRLQALQGGTPLVTTEAGQPVLVQVVAGRGSVVWCGAALAPEASNLAGGGVLVPLVQRLLAQGADRLSAVEYRDCALLPPDVRASCVRPPGPDGDRAAGLKAGILRCRFAGRDGMQTVVLRRPEACDLAEEMAAAEVAARVGPSLCLADAASRDAWDASSALLLLALMFLGAALAAHYRRRQDP